MASTKAWVGALNKVIPVVYPDLKTTEVYSRIKRMGFPTVEWIELAAKNNSEKEIKQLLDSAEKFIMRNKPCLFIFDPKDSSVKKGYFVDLESIDAVKDWISQNTADLEKYFFHITSQIVNPGNGIIGIVFSDGKGKIFCETLHLSKGSSHRLLTQPEKDISNSLDFFTADNFEAETAGGRFLSAKDISTIISLFADKKGYFEFVKGRHLGKTGFVIIGFEESQLFAFPHQLLDNFGTQASKRFTATALKNQ